MGKGGPTGIATTTGSPDSNATTAPVLAGIGAFFPRDWRGLVGDIVAGITVSIVLIGNIIGFSALMAPPGAGNVATVLWVLLIGSCLSGIVIALMTSLPPIAAGLDTPTGAVFVLLGAAVGAQVAAAGGSGSAVTHSVLLIFWVASIISGLLLLGLGAIRWGYMFRFVPYCVVGGFLAATGWLLIAGAIRMTSGRALDLAGLQSSWRTPDILMLAGALVLLVVLLQLRKWIKSPFVTSLFLVLLCIVANAVLWQQGLWTSNSGWYIPSIGALPYWSPLAVWNQNGLSSGILLQTAPEIFAASAVALLSLVTKTSSIEVMRSTSADLDREFIAHGAGALAAGAAGGISGAVQVGSSRLLQDGGGQTRFSGVVTALIFGAVALFSFDLPSFVPKFVVGGLVLYLGYGFLIDAFKRPFLQKSWADLILILVIAIICVQFGYVVGVLAGCVAACLVFAYSYARVSAIKRHTTRAGFSSNVDRSLEAAQFLRGRGEAIQIYWLTGYVFFGTSDRIFQMVKADVEKCADGVVRYVLIDFAAVTGADSSAVLSLVKLRNYFDKKGIVLVCSSLVPSARFALEKDGFFGPKSPHRSFNDRNAALEWCEEELLKERAQVEEMVEDKIPVWLASQLGNWMRPDFLLSYLERRFLRPSSVLYRQGDPADSIDFIAQGNLAIEIDDGSGKRLRVRRLATHSIVGEMGFFRQQSRSATVVADGPAVIFTLDRKNFERMLADDPKLAASFYEFVIHVLADRLEFANREITILAR